jgi:hypothetical protein
MKSKLSLRAWSWLIGFALLSAFLGHWYWDDSHSLVTLRPGGKATFYRGAFFHKDKFELAYTDRAWRFWKAEERKESNLPIWMRWVDTKVDAGELIIPFECEYNDVRTLRLEGDGKVYMIDHKSMIREELRVVDGEWSYDASDHWQSIFDLYDVYND